MIRETVSLAATESLQPEYKPLELLQQTRKLGYGSISFAVCEKRSGPSFFGLASFQGMLPLPQGEFTDPE